jgi:hypothetical protein
LFPRLQGFALPEARPLVLLTDYSNEVMLWDNLNTHGSKRMQAFVTAHADWLTVVRLPAYAPNSTPPRAFGPHLKRALGNCAATGIDHLADLVKARLKRLQYRPDLLDGFLGQTGLILDSGSP